jgi:F420-dependent oxidoreductase-like protein
MEAMPPVQLGAHIGQQNLPMTELRDLWRRLDAAGLDWISLWDHLYEVPPQGGTQPHYEGLTALAALCADTSHARIGVLMCCVCYRNPAYLAKAATTLDHISGGRFELGLGAGWAEDEARAYGYEFPPVGTRLDMLEDALSLVRSMLSQERTTHQGRFYTTADAANVPQPVRGHMPLWVGGQGERRTPRIAATHADGWNAPYLSPELFARISANIDRVCEELGRDPATLERSVNVGFYLSTDPDQVPVMEAQLRESAGDMADVFMSGLLLGTPDQALDRIMEYVEAGAQGINVALRAPVDEDALSAYIDEVIPVVRAATS